MKIAVFFLTLFMVLAHEPCRALSLGLSCSAEKTGDTIKRKDIVPRTRQNFQTSVGYWNDNFIVPRLFGEKLNQGKDDFETASFWLQTAREKTGIWWFFDAYYNILTNKKGKYRTDLLTFRLSLEKEFSFGSLRLGTGIIASGNFGGETLQNGYHRISGTTHLSLPYAEKDRRGIIGLARYHHSLWRTNAMRFNGYVSNSLRTSVGPCNVRTGLEMHVVTRPLKRAYVLHVQAQAGYFHYYRTGRYMSPLFREGFMWGMLFSGGRAGKYNIGLWFTDNQYGLDQPHFGISMIIGWNRNRMSDLSDVTFP
ncbi:hypothetical protein LLG96_18230 [bacterium]|nr:hypothetical protein [bacterium]